MALGLLPKISFLLLKNPLELPLLEDGGSTTSLVGLKKFFFYDSLKPKLLLYLICWLSLIGDLLPWDI